MRNLITSLAPLLLLAHVGCDAAEKGRAEAKREAEADDKQKAASIKPVDKIKTPVPQGTHLTCPQVIDPTAYTGALEELEPIKVGDSTRGFVDSTVSCTLLRGGERPDAKAQAAIAKKQGRLGVLPGDPI